MSNADVVYYNLTIGNNDPAQAGKLDYTTIPAQITALNNIPILHNPDEYYGCIIRFTIPAIDVPLLTFLIQTPVNDINLGIYSFTIFKSQGNPTNPMYVPTNTSGRVFVEWLPEVILPTAQIPVATGQLIQPINPYYLAYDYTHFINLWNTALATAHQLLYADGSSPPYFNYDAPTQLIQLYTPLYYDTDQTNIGFNNALLQYLVGLYTINVNQGGADNTSGIDNIIIPSVRTNNQVKLTDISNNTITDWNLTSSQYNSYGYWNWLKSIVITTTMNVNSEVVFNNNNTTSQNVNYINILEDYQPDLAIPNGAGISNQIFTYQAQSLFRVWCFNQKTPLYKVDLGINLIDTYGNLYPLVLPKGQQANFKIMFIKKSIYASVPKMIN